MYEQVEKPEENKSRGMANSVTQKKSNGKQGFGFVDNRPEKIAQLKLQSTFTKNSQPKSPSSYNTNTRARKETGENTTIQRQTEIAYTAGAMTYWAGGPWTQNLTVGMRADALLDPANPKTGSRTATAPTPSPYTNGNWPTLYQGHLLNANLGGQAIPQNLFPVTPTFNSQHSSIIEDNVKAELLALHARQVDPLTSANYQNRRLHYSVQVINPNIAAPFRPADIGNTVFRCTKEYTQNNIGIGLGTGVDHHLNHGTFDVSVPAPPDLSLNSRLSALGWAPDAAPSYTLGPAVAPNVHSVLDGGGVVVPNMHINT